MFKKKKIKKELGKDIVGIPAGTLWVESVISNLYKNLQKLILK